MGHQTGFGATDNVIFVDLGCIYRMFTLETLKTAHLLFVCVHTCASFSIKNGF